MSVCIGVDVGGTFTDFVIVGPEGMRLDKRLSSPEDPARSVLAGLEGLDPEACLPVVHGTTVATNALLERRGARLAFVGTSGFEDLLALGRARRRDLYALEPRERPSLVAPGSGLAFGLSERVAADGSVLESPDAAELDRVARAVLDSGAESVAVCLLFSYLRPEHERRLAEALRAMAPEGPAISLSVDVLPEMREYERASTTAVNAYVQPVMARYLRRLARAAAPRPLSVMASHAGSLPPESAASLPVATVLSGPAAGVLGALIVARQAGLPRVISFDMGGTSTDVALCDDAVPFTGRSEIGGLPIHRPSVDVHTVGAGGGSIVRLDEGGVLRVGPESAGALPGPAAYGRGGRQATITDAHVLLGRLPVDRPLAGGLRLDAEAARRAFEPLAARLACEPESAALAALEVADAIMERALRRVSVERGQDPADFGLLAFGGAGGLHACALAESIDARHLLIPRLPGALSALGLATATPVATASRSLGRSARSPELLERVFAELEDEAASQLPRTDALERQRLVDLRYAGQSWELSLPWPEDGDLRRVFEQAHEQHYGFRRPGLEVEIVTLRLRLSGPPPAQLPPFAPPRREEPVERGHVLRLPDGREARVPLLDRLGLAPGRLLPAPCLVTQEDSTVFIAPGWAGRVLDSGDLLLWRERAAGASPGRPDGAPPPAA